MNKLAVITVHQPWAQWVIDGHKPIETRTHQRFKCLVGKTILIHSSQKFNDEGCLYYHNSVGYKNGVILGAVYVKEFRELDKHDSEDANINCGSSIKRYGLILTDFEKFDEPIPAKGGQGIWYFDLDSKKRVSK